MSFYNFKVNSKRFVCLKELVEMLCSFIKEVASAVSKVKDIRPLVLSITNYVTMDIVANSLLALGARPIMSVCSEELEELVAIADAVNVNIGTLDQSFVDRCHIVAEFAKKYNKPLVFDPVGSGATIIRTKSAQELVQYADIVRGNASEIMSLAGSDAKTLGVESLNTTDQAKLAAVILAKKFNLTVIVSGAEDFVTDGTKKQSLFFGSDLMPLITGMGCALNGVIASFRATLHDSFNAAVLAVSYFGLCGNLAEVKFSAPGTFRNAFIDELYNANFDFMNSLSAQGLIHEVIE